MYLKREKTLTSTILPFSPCGTRSADIARFLGLFAEDRDDKSLFRRQFALTLGRDLADENVVRADFCADADDAVLVQILQSVFADIRNVTRHLFRSQFGVAGFQFVLLNVD